MNRLNRESFEPGSLVDRELGKKTGRTEGYLARELVCLRVGGQAIG